MKNTRYRRTLHFCMIWSSLMHQNGLLSLSSGCLTERNHLVKTIRFRRGSLGLTHLRMSPIILCYPMFNFLLITLRMMSAVMTMTVLILEALAMPIARILLTNPNLWK